MHSPRAQADKKAYQALAKLTVERQPGLTLRQEMVEALTVESGRIAGVRCRGGRDLSRPRAVVVTTGTFLQALMHTGEVKTAGGRRATPRPRGYRGASARSASSFEAVQDRDAAPAQRPDDRLQPGSSPSRATSTPSRSRS